MSRWAGNETEFERELDCEIRYYGVRSETEPREYALSCYLQRCMERFEESSELREALGAVPSEPRSETP
jgi:hypothetical protein